MQKIVPMEQTLYRRPLPADAIAFSSVEGRQLFAENLALCKRIGREEWRVSQTFWSRLKQRWAYFILARMDLYLARRQLAGLR